MIHNCVIYCKICKKLKFYLFEDLHNYNQHYYYVEKDEQALQ